MRAVAFLLSLVAIGGACNGALLSENTGTGQWWLHYVAGAVVALALVLWRTLSIGGTAVAETGAEKGKGIDGRILPVLVGSLVTGASVFGLVTSYAEGQTVNSNKVTAEQNYRSYGTKLFNSCDRYGSEWRRDMCTEAVSDIVELGPPPKMAATLMELEKQTKRNDWAKGYSWAGAILGGIAIVVGLSSLLNEKQTRGW